MKYLTLFTIGPVQNFITQARKLQDLYAGSFLLSYLCEQTINMARNQTALPVQAVILFPDSQLESAPNSQLKSMPGSRPKSAPNRFLMTVETQDAEVLRQFCVFLEQYVRRQWTTIAHEVFKQTKLIYSEAVAVQIESLIQVYYASEQYCGGSEFGGCYKKVIKRLGAAKTLRGFVQLDEPYGRKCNLMHEHNALFYRKKSRLSAEPAYLVADAQPVTENKVHDLNKYIEEDETLGGIALVKRCLKFGISGFSDRFPSVTDIYEMHGQEDAPHDDRRGYYAMVMFDGDDMGRWYSEPDQKGVASSALEDFQAYLSRAISTFAAEGSRKIVDWEAKKNGVVIYAGGEDFLGALNVKNVFAALGELRELFGKIDLLPYTAAKLSFSAGVAIAHVKTPLAVVLEMAREAEHRAKAYRHKDRNKDAFCLSIAKRSGETSSFVQPFYYDGESSLATLERLVELLLTKGMSVKFIYQLGEELGRLAETDAAGLQWEIFMAEAARLLKHSAFEDRDQGAEIVREVVEILTKLVKMTEMSLGDLLIYLRAIAFIARERGAVL